MASSLQLYIQHFCFYDVSRPLKCRLLAMHHSCNFCNACNSNTCAANLIYACSLKLYLGCALPSLAALSTLGMESIGYCIACQGEEAALDTVVFLALCTSLVLPANSELQLCSVYLVGCSPWQISTGPELNVPLAILCAIPCRQRFSRCCTVEGEVTFSSGTAVPSVKMPELTQVYRMREAQVKSSAVHLTGICCRGP